MAPSSQVAMGRLFEGGIAKAAIPRIGSRHVPRRGEHFNPKFSVEKALLNSRSHENELAFWLDMALSPSETSGSHPHFKLPKQSYLQ